MRRRSLGKRVKMAPMRRSVKQKVIGAAAVAVLLAAGSIAAVSATGQSNPAKHRHAHARRAHAHDLSVAAGYLGVTSAQLSSELSSGKTLAQIADATGGRSSAGLADSLVAAHRAKLAAAGAKLPQRIAAEINRAGGPARAGVAGRSGGTKAVAAHYLGVPSAQLRADLHAGKTLAQVADATPGKSTAGLIAALVSAKRAKVAAAAAAGRIPASREAKRLAHLDKRAGALVQRKFAGAGSP
jgi:hypothetical protein